MARTYARVTSIALDPIEKKPLYHFHPGSTVLSLGTLGCNLACQFCQNWQISQDEATLYTLSPQDAVRLALKYQDRGCIGIAYTYSEPSVWFEYVLDTAVLAREAGLKNVMVTNGLINRRPLRQLLAYIDAFNIDIKSMSDEFYRKYCGACGKTARQTAILAAEHAHVEITNLLITGLNDSEEDVRALARWIRDHLGASTPLHISRYFPAYKLSLPPTPIARLKRAREVALQYLEHVYLGNVSINSA